MNNKKGSKGGNIHPGHNKKRRFNGNRYITQNDMEFTSASAKKL